MMSKDKTIHFIRICFVSVLLVFALSGITLASSIFTRTNFSTNSTTGVSTYKQESYTNRMYTTEEKTLKIPIENKSYISVSLIAENQTGCDTKVYLIRKSKSTGASTTVKSLVKTSGTGTTTASWLGTAYPDTYDYYIKTYAHKGLAGYSAPSAIVTIKPYYQLSYDEVGGNGTVKIYKDNSLYSTLTADKAFIDIVAGTKFYLTVTQTESEFEFEGWEGAVTGSSTTSPVFYLNKDKTVQAVFNDIVVDAPTLTSTSIVTSVGLADFRWNTVNDYSGIAKYQLALTQNTSQPTSNIINVVSNIRSYLFSNLSSKNTYYAWVRAVDGNNNVSSWTRTGRFSTDSQLATISAEASSEIQSEQPVYRVELTLENVDAAKYYLERDGSNLTSLSYDQLSANGFKYTDTEGLEKHKTYTYGVYTKNADGTFESVKRHDIVNMPNIKPSYTFSPGENLLTKERNQTFDIDSGRPNKAKLDYEDDNLKFRVYYKQNSGSTYTTAYRVTPIALTFPSDGDWEWWLEVVEYDSAANLQSAEKTSHRAIRIDSLAPDGNFTIKDRQSDVDYVVEGRTNTEAVKILLQNITDSFTGVNRIYLWNQKSSRPTMYDITTVMDNNNQIKSQYVDLIKSGTAGILVNTSTTPVPIQWLLNDSSNGLKMVYLEIEDVAGNVKRVSKSLILDRTGPSIPFDFSHSYTGNMINFFWKANNSDGDIAKFICETNLNGQFFEVTPNGTTIMEGQKSFNVAHLGYNEGVIISVKAVDLAGNESAIGSYTAYTTARPGSITCVNAGYDPDAEDYYMLWRIDDTIGADSFELEYENSDGVFSSDDVIHMNANGEFIHTGLSAHQIYYYRVVSINGSGYRTYSIIRNKMMPNTPPTAAVPISPEGYVNTSTVSFNFQESTDVDGDQPLKYYIYIGSGVSPEADEFDVLNFDQYQTKDGLSHGQTYTWFVEAKDLPHTGESLSEKVQFTVDTMPPAIEIDRLPDRPTKQTSITFTAADTVSGVAGATFIKRVDGITVVDNQTIPLTPVMNDTMCGTIPLEEGAYDIELIIQDRAGNQKSSGSQLSNLLIDHSSPILSNVVIRAERDEGYYASAGLVPITVDAVDDFSSVHNLNLKLRYWFVQNLGDELAQEGTVINLSSAQDIHERTLKMYGEDGQHYYLVMVIEDQAGNISDKYVSPESILIDTSYPELSFTLGGLVNHRGDYYLTDINNLTEATQANDNDSSVYPIEYLLVSALTGSPVSEWNEDFEMIKTVNLNPGSKYKILARTTNGVGLVRTVESKEFVFDNIKPEILGFAGPTIPLVIGEEAMFEISLRDTHSPIIECQLGIGSTPGGTDLTDKIAESELGWISLNPSVTQYRFEIPETEYGTYYPTLQIMNAAGLSQTAGIAPFTISQYQEKLVVSDGAPYTKYDDRLSGKWRYAGAKAITGYRYKIECVDSSVVQDWQLTDKSSLTVYGLRLEEKKEYRFVVEAIFSDGSANLSGVSSGVIVDTTPAELYSFLTDEYSLSSSLKVNYYGRDLESGIGNVQVALGSDFNLTDVTQGWVDLIDYRLNCDIDGNSLDLVTGQRYYLSLRLINGAGLVTEAVPKCIVIDDTPPDIPIVWDQGDFINLTQNLQANWLWSPVDQESGVAGYEWALLTDIQDMEAAEWHDAGTATQISLPAGRTDGQTYYFAVKTINGAGLTNIGISDGITVDATAPIIHDVKVLDAVNIGNPETADDINYISSTQGLKLWITAYDWQSDVGSYLYAWGDRATVASLPRNESTTNKIELPTLQLADDEITVFLGEAVNNAGDVSATGYSTGIMLDTQNPRITSVNGTIHDDIAVFDWEAIPSKSPIAGYRVKLVSGADLYSVPAFESMIDVGLNRNYSIDVTNLPEGSYYLLVMAYSRANTRSVRGGEGDEWGISPKIIIDRSGPVVNNFRYDSFASEILNVQFTAVDEVSGVVGYRYALGSATDPFAYSRDWVSSPCDTGQVSLEIPLDSIEQGSVVYLKVGAKNGAGLWSLDHRILSMRVDRTRPEVPIVTGPDFITNLIYISGISFTAEELESRLEYYQLGIVEYPGGPWLNTPVTMSIGGFVSTMTGLNLSEEPGTYYLALKVCNAVGLWSEIGYSELIRVDATPPELTFENEEVELVKTGDSLKVKYTLTEDSQVKFWWTPVTGKPAESEAGSLGTNYFSFDENIYDTYTLYAQPTDLAGNTGVTKTRVIKVNQPPTVELPVELSNRPGESLQPGEPITFSAYYVGDNDGSVVEYQWDPGDGQPILTGATPEYRYFVPGDYTVTLTVKDNDGVTTSANSVVKVRNSSQGTLFTDETWAEEHHITGDLTIPVGKTLTILPGTKVIIDSLAGQLDYNHQVTVKGTLFIQGTITENVTFELLTGTPGSWQGIYIEGQASIDGLVIQHALRGVTIVDSADVEITNSLFTNNNVAIHVYNAQPTISNTTFSDNIWYGIKEDTGGRPIVVNCLFMNNNRNYYDKDNQVISIEQLNQKTGNHDNIAQ